MLVDDDDAVNFIHRILLRGMDPNLKVTTVWNGKECIDFLESAESRNDPPQLILLDINMPVKTGWEFLDELETRNIEAKGDLVILMVSASMNPEDLERSRRYEKVRKYVTKPLVAEELEATCREYFTLRSSADAGV